MTAIHETAYPRIRSNLSDHELETLYTPMPDDLVFLHRTTKSTVAVFGGLVLLKTFQRLGYFPPMDTLPPSLIQHLATTMGVLIPDVLLQQYDQRRLREWQAPEAQDIAGTRGFCPGPGPPCGPPRTTYQVRDLLGSSLRFRAAPCTPPRRRPGRDPAGPRRGTAA
jgi:hypothetical protein